MDQPVGGNPQNGYKKNSNTVKEILPGHQQDWVNDHTNRFFIELKILNLSELHTWQISKFVYR